MPHWSMDFVSDQLGNDRRFLRALNIVDDHSRFCPGQIADVSIPDARIARFLDDRAVRLGLPEEIAPDNRPEGSSRAMFDGSERTGVRLGFIELGKPVQNAFVETFDGKFRDECLNPRWFRPPGHAREEIARWRTHDNNTERRHSSLGDLSPKEFLTTRSTPALNTANQPEHSGSAWP